MVHLVSFVAQSEAWNEYHLDDGSVIRARLILSKVTRDGNNEDGSPRYLCGFQQILDVTPGENAQVDVHDNVRKDAP